MSLFDRAKRRQICLYASGGRQPRYTEDDGRALDLLHHDLQVRFEPDAALPVRRGDPEMQPPLPASTVRLRLDDAFRVESVSSAEGGQHLFFRVRDQNTLMVSLGALAGARGEISLTVRYSGTHEPGARRPGGDPGGAAAPSRCPPSPRGDQLEGVLVYTNRTAWYPRPQLDDHATARLRFDVPVGLSAVTGGERVSARVEGPRTLVEYRQDRPGEVHHGRGGPASSRGRRPGDGRPALRAFGLAAHRATRPSDLLQSSARILSFFAARFGPCPYPDLDLAAHRGRSPGRPQPRRAWCSCSGGRPCSAAPCVTIPRTSATCPASSWPTSWRTSGGARASPAPELSRALALRRLRPVRGRAVGAREPGRARFRDVLERFGRWAIRYDDEGPIHLGYRVGHLRGDPQAYRAVVYDKGGLRAPHAARGRGRRCVPRGLRAFQEAHRYSKAGTDDLREALEAASGKDLRAHFQAWVFGTGIARLSYRWSRQEVGGEHRVDVRLEATGLPGAVPLQVTVVHAEGAVSRAGRDRTEGRARHDGSAQPATTGRGERRSRPARLGFG